MPNGSTADQRGMFKPRGAPEMGRGMGRERLRSFFICGQLILIGLIWRLAPLGLSAFPRKYGGSILWAAMIYFLVRGVWPRTAPAPLALGAGLIALAVEVSRLLHTPWLDAFRLSLPGALLLGRIFSPWNLLAYGIGIFCAALGDWLILSRKR